MTKEKKEPPLSSHPISSEDIRTGTSPEVISRAILDNLYYLLGRIPVLATPHDWYTALAATVRDRLLENWVKSTRLLNRGGRANTCRKLSVRGIPDRPSVGEYPALSRPNGSGATGGGGTGAGSGTTAGAGRGTGPGQRWPGKAGGLFYGFPVDAWVFRPSGTGSATNSVYLTR